MKIPNFKNHYLIVKWILTYIFFYKKLKTKQRYIHKKKIQNLN